MSSGDNTLTKSLKISDTTKTKFFELKSFQSDKKIWQNYCREVFSSLSDFLTSWLSITILTEGFLAIYVTTLLAVYNFGNTSAIKAIFFFKMFKIWRRFQKFWKKLRKIFFFGDNSLWIGSVKHSLLPRENTCHRESTCYQRVSRFQILLRQNFSNRNYFKVTKTMSKLLPSRFGQCFGPFNMLTLQKCSDAGFFRNLSNHAFCSL